MCLDRNLPDHPVITNTERTGYPDGKEPCYPRCPVCGEECDTLYKSANREIVGCENCVDNVDAWDELEQDTEEDYDDE